jgi:hypothetical protein
VVVRSEPAGLVDCFLASWCWRFGVDEWSIRRGGAVGLAVYAVLFAGWTSNSKYAFLGGCRSAAGMISYELPMTMIVMTLASLLGFA